jgi:hypothetical protein
MEWDGMGTDRVVVCHFEDERALCCAIFHAVPGLLDGWMDGVM